MCITADYEWRLPSLALLCWWWGRCLCKLSDWWIPMSQKHSIRVYIIRTCSWVVCQKSYEYSLLMRAKPAQNIHCPGITAWLYLAPKRQFLDLQYASKKHFQICPVLFCKIVPFVSIIDSYGLSQFCSVLLCFVQHIVSSRFQWCRT